MPSMAIATSAPSVIQDTLPLPPHFPELPDDLLERFPSLKDWEQDVTAWWTKTQFALQSSTATISDSTTAQNQSTEDLRLSINGSTASITVEKNARIAADGILAQRIVTVSAMAGISSNITVSTTPPVAPSNGDYWINTSSAVTPVTYRWNGAAWLEVTTQISFAGVAAEQTARVTADGFLSGKYTLTVIAGNVVTGMNITSSTGGGTNVSSVIFRATDFQIYNGVSGVVMFNVSGSTVQLAGTLTVSTSGKVFVGVGTYANSNTYFYADNTGQFSLGDKLTWDGANLSVTGSITVTSISGLNYAGSPSAGGAANTIVSQGALATLSAIGYGSAYLTGTPISATTGAISVANAPAGAGLYLGSTYMGYYDGAAWKTYMDSSGHFYLGGTSGSLQWNGSTLLVSGSIILSAATAPSGAGLYVGSTYMGYYDGAVWKTFMDSSGDFYLGGVGGALQWVASSASLSITSGNGPATTVISITGGIFTHSDNALGLTTEIGPGGISSGFAAPASTSTGFMTYYANIPHVYFALRGFFAGNQMWNLDQDQFLAPANGPLSGVIPALSFYNANKTGIDAATNAELDIVVNAATIAKALATRFEITQPLRLDNAYVAGAPAATGYVTLQDSAGVTYKVLVST